MPLLTSLGTAAGWRMPFVVLAVLAAVTLALLAKALPAVGHDPGAHPVRPQGRGRLIAVVTSNMLVFLGQFTVYTFISVLLLTGGVTPAFIGPVLLLCGACGLAGLWYAGRGLDRDPRRTTAVLLAASAAGVAVLRVTSSLLWATLLAITVWCTAFGGVPSIYQACAVRIRAVSPERAGAWVNATSNAGIAGGSAIGAGLLGTAGLSSLPWAGAALILLGMAVAMLSRNAFPSEP
ncbi:MFS transporter [Mycobacterium sp. NAZ190054]|uniref:MFS transporter n=1 Tax=Mycobacterium sp. NAZ190054 TaxID=1747766 RepID=UPI0018D26173|nr:MFS transporter [Mycobacterium sp. NAZ190054]